MCTLVAQEKRTISLAVSDLTAQGVKQNEAAIITEQLRVELIKIPHIRLIERSQMQEILKEQGFQQSGCTNDACAVEIGQLLGVNNIVVGSVGIAGSYTVLSVRVLDVKTGEIVINESIRTKGGIDKMLEQGIQQIASKLQARLFPDNSQLPATTPQSNKSGTKKTLIFAGGGALLVGGAAAAVLLLKSDDTPKETVPTPNTSLELP
jgi:TolB-like protein